VSVSDEGGALSVEFLPHVCDVLSAPDQLRQQREVGLHLAIARRIMRAHGGAIEVDVKRGERTTFVLRSPGTDGPE
jgi:signal transduction histidine kinase